MDSATLVPARIVNEHVYCPRLAWFEWEAQAFTDNAETAEGSDLHRRVDVEAAGIDADAEDEERLARATSVTLASERLGVVAKLDKVESGAGEAVPVETKRGRPRKGALPVWEPELAQLTIQALLLREHGFQVPHAEVFFAGARGRHEVAIPEDAEERIARLVGEIRANVAKGRPPPPLVDSPKCPRCSLVGVCLPDETNRLRKASSSPPRRLVAADPAARPLYALGPGSVLRKRGRRLVLERDGEEVASRRMLDVSHLAIFGNASITSATMRACLESDIPVMWFSYGGWFNGYAVAHGGSWVARRRAQHRAADDPDRAVLLARRFIYGKIRNQRTMLRRLAGSRVRHELDSLDKLARQAAVERTAASLLGIEGTAARLYFGRFALMVKQMGAGFDLAARNRRPSTDPVNASLSFVYALLLRDATSACLAAGVDPQVGLLHQPRFGRPSLALDLAEEFRPLLGDSAVIGAINNGELRAGHFVERAGAVGLTAKGRRAMIDAYERRVHSELTHPLFGYKTSYRRTIELQARQLAAVLEGQFERYEPVMTR